MGDRRKCQTYAASPAEPGGLPVMLGAGATVVARLAMEPLQAISLRFNLS